MKNMPQMALTLLIVGFVIGLGSLMMTSMRTTTIVTTSAGVANETLGTHATYSTLWTLAHIPVTASSETVDVRNETGTGATNFTVTRLVRNTHYTITPATGVINITGFTNGTTMQVYANYTYTYNSNTAATAVLDNTITGFTGFASLQPLVATVIVFVALLGIVIGVASRFGMVQYGGRGGEGGGTE